jgi:NhaA family Na+:H+ antiporter
MAQHDSPLAAEVPLPKEPIQRLVAPLTRFLHVEAASGIVLLLATVVALVLANSAWGPGFLGLWKAHVVFRVGGFEFDHSIKHLINDGLMVIFFFVIGLEVKREIVVGELREARRAALPIAAALGGMIAPAALYLALQMGEAGQRGWGIPMATDIAFVVGCMAVLGSRVPHGLRVMLLSLAIADDIGAILVIAIGYTDDLSFAWLLTGLAGIVAVGILSRLGVRSFLVYTLMGVFVWFAFHESGVHATIAGVILGLMTPARAYISPGLFGQVLNRVHRVIHGDWEEVPRRAQGVRHFQQLTRETIPPLEYLENLLHPWVAFFIMPLFALANAGVPVNASDLGAPVALAILLGLAVGKPLGITLLAWIAVRLGLARLPQGVGWGAVLAGGCLCGIGFTMAMFIASLALEGDLLNTAKIGVLTASLISAVVGMLLLVWLLPKPASAQKS